MGNPITSLQLKTLVAGVRKVLPWGGIPLSDDAGGAAGIVALVASDGSPVTATAPLPTTQQPTAPAAANVAGGATQADGITLVTIPANRTWQGWVAVQGALQVAAGGGAGAGNVRIDTVGAGTLPYVGSLVRVDLSSPAVGAAVTPVAEEGSQAMFVTVQAPAAGATIVAHTAGLTAANMSAVGVFL